MKLRARCQSIPLSLALLCCAANMSAQAAINDAANALTQEGDKLVTQQKYMDALRSYQSANRADPTSSQPLSRLASLLYTLSGVAETEKKRICARRRRGLRNKHRNWARSIPSRRECCACWPRKSRRLCMRRRPTRQSCRMKASSYSWPENSTRPGKIYARHAGRPVVFGRLGLCGRLLLRAEKVAGGGGDVPQGRDDRAAQWPGLALLVGALAAQGKRAAAEEALLNGIAAQPSQMPNWTKLAKMRAAAGTSLKPLGLVRKASVTLDPATGKPTIKLDSTFSGGPGEQKTADGGTWLMLSMGEANIRAKKCEGNITSTPFAIELASWEGAMKSVDEITAKGGEAPTDPGLIAMRMLAKADQLEAGLLILQYKESYRPEFEAWKKAHPNGIRKFVDTWGLQP